MRQSDKLRDEEATKQDRGAQGDHGLTEKNEYIRPDEDGVYHVQPIVCCGDFIAIAPLAPETTTKGGIVLTNQTDRPSTGIILGGGGFECGKGHQLPIGSHVKFTPQHQVADLSGHYPFYGPTIILAYRSASVVSFLPPVEYETVVDRESPPGAS